MQEKPLVHQHGRPLGAMEGWPRGPRPGSRSGLAIASSVTLGKEMV